MECGCGVSVHKYSLVHVSSKWQTEHNFVLIDVNVGPLLALVANMKAMVRLSKVASGFPVYMAPGIVSVFKISTLVSRYIGTRFQ